MSEQIGERVVLTITPQQANAMVMALDLFTRIGLGQLEEVSALVRQGVVPLYGESGTKRRTAGLSDFDGIEGALAAVKGILGYPRNASMGIGHPHVCIEARRCYEVRKVVEKALAEWREPNPGFRGVTYDGLGPRYTRDPAPVAEVVELGSEADR